MNIQTLSTKNISDETSSLIAILFKQLSPDKKQLNLSEILETGNTTIAICIENNMIIGIALMAKYKVISGLKGWIEDVVVDSEHRRKGVGKALIQYLIEEAIKNNYTQLYLFTEPEKEAAANLYQKLGFNKRTSILFDMKF